MSKLNLMICDDHPLIIEGLKSYLTTKNDLDVVATANTIAELYEKLKIKKIDILILDINLPDGSGVEACKVVHNRFSKIKILGLTNTDEKELITKMMSNGAAGFLLKESPVSEIETAIREIHSNGIYLSKDVQKILLKKEEPRNNACPKLTKREKEVLQLLAQGYSTPEISAKMFVSTETISSHRKNLLNKFKVSKTVIMLKKAKECTLID
ncbi:MAG: response regulator transcription factor [Cruoricaptor ignavus]|nr:response regulator transcription factor [Cruoricaptor ignavus]